MNKTCESCGSTVFGFKCPKCSKFCPDIVEEEIIEEITEEEAINEEIEEALGDEIEEVSTDVYYEDEEDYRAFQGTDWTLEMVKKDSQETIEQLKQLIK